MLARAGVPVDERDMFRQPLSLDEVRELAGLRPAGELFSWRSVRARREGWQPGALQAEDLLRLMADDPSLIRRPLVRAGDALITGHDPAALAALALARG